MPPELRTAPTWSPEQIAQAVALIDAILALGDEAYSVTPPPPPRPDGVLMLDTHPHVYHPLVRELMGLTLSVPDCKTWDVRFPEDEALLDSGPEPDPSASPYETYGHPDRLSRSSANQVWRFLTFLTRAEYWNSGPYADAIKDGRLAIARDRLSSLSSSIL